MSDKKTQSQRATILEEAAKCVLKDRAKTYGPVEDSFDRIARLWSAYLGTEIGSVHVAPMMMLLKLGRLRENPAHQDNYIDIAGYAACGGEIALKLGRAIDAQQKAQTGRDPVQVAPEFEMTDDEIADFWSEGEALAGEPPRRDFATGERIDTATAAPDDPGPAISSERMKGVNLIAHATPAEHNAPGAAVQEARQKVIDTRNARIAERRAAREQQAVIGEVFVEKPRPAPLP